MSELSLSPLSSLKERPQYVRHLEQLQARYERWQARVEAGNQRVLNEELQRELGLIGLLSSRSRERLESECGIVSYEPHGRRGNVIRTDHLAWDLGIDDDTTQPDTYTPHLYLARSNSHFYRGDPGNAMPHQPVTSAQLVSRVVDLRSSFQQ